MASTNTEVGIEAGAKAPFPPFQTETFASQLLWLALTFGLFYILMSKVVLPRISSILETRSGRIAQDLDEANRLKTESDEAIAAYEQELADAKSRAHAIAQEANETAKADLDAKRQSVEAELMDKIAVAEKRIAAIKTEAMSQVGTIAEDTTAELVTQLMGGKVTKAEIAAAVANVKS